MMNVRFALGGLFLLVSTAFSQVTREQAIATAEAYRTLKWRPSTINVFHGWDANGVRVDTPDIGFRSAGTRPGWWIPNRHNMGMPYMWGGFSSLPEFMKGVRDGKYAGDVYTLEKRRLLDAAVSTHAVGIDCSGLISRCWRLERSYSTQELPELCIRLRSYNELERADILNSFNNHALLFHSFKDRARTRLFAYEAGSPPTWKVLLNDIPVSLLKNQGYGPFRYRKIYGE